MLFIRSNKYKANLFVCVNISSYCTYLNKAQVLINKVNNKQQDFLNQPRMNKLVFFLVNDSLKLSAKQCEPGFVFRSGITSCPRTCDNVFKMPDKCYEGEKVSMCTCPENKYLQDGKCVDATECKCRMNGKTYGMNEVAYLKCNPW